MRVMINATGCPAPVLDRNRMNTHKHLSQLIASAVDHVQALQNVARDPLLITFLKWLHQPSQRGDFSSGHTPFAMQ